MRLGYGLLAVIFLIAFPANSEADELGAQEVRAALTGIEHRCAADLPTAIATALSSINTAARQQGVDPIKAQSTPQGVLDAFAQTLQAAPDLGEQALARTVVNSILYEVDAAVEEGYAERLACNCTAGVGLELRSSPPNHTIVEPLPGTPAEQAGLLANDILIAINGTDTAGLPLAQVVRLIRGEPGSTVAVTVRRAGETEPQTFNITRVIIRVRAVTWSVDDGVGYIRVRSFTEDTGRAVRDALRDIRRQVRAPHGYVLDLRNNSGGLLDQVIEVADLFLDGGAVVTVRDDAG